MFQTQTPLFHTVSRCKAGMCEYVGHHYILISLTFPQLAHPTSQGVPIRPNSNLQPKSGQLLTNIWFNEGCSSMCHSVRHCRYTALCGLAPASLHFEAVWWSQVEGSLGGMKAWSMHSVAGKAKLTAWMKDRVSWPCSLSPAALPPLYASFTVDSSLMIHVITLSSLHLEHFSSQLANTRCPVVLNLRTDCCDCEDLVSLVRRQLCSVCWNYLEVLIYRLPRAQHRRGETILR